MDQLTFEMITHENATYFTSETPIPTKTNATGVVKGLVPGDNWVYCAIPASMNAICYQDNGFGGLTDFNEEDNLGVNGIPMVYNGVDYLLFGEYVSFSNQYDFYMIEQ